MIIKFKQYNESLRDLMVGPTKEEVWKSYGYDKPFDTPESFFLYIIKNIKREPFSKHNTSVVHWLMDDEIVFQQLLSSGLLNIDNYKIWRVFKNIFDMKEQEIKYLISDMVEKYLKIKDYSVDVAVFK